MSYLYNGLDCCNCNVLYEANDATGAEFNQHYSAVSGSIALPHFDTDGTAHFLGDTAYEIVYPCALYAKDNIGYFIRAIGSMSEMSYTITLGSAATESNKEIKFKFTRYRPVEHTGNAPIRAGDYTPCDALSDVIEFDYAVAPSLNSFIEEEVSYDSPRWDKLVITVNDEEIFNSEPMCLVFTGKVFIIHNDSTCKTASDYGIYAELNTSDYPYMNKELFISKEPSTVDKPIKIKWEIKGTNYYLANRANPSDSTVYPGNGHTQLWKPRKDNSCEFPEVECNGLRLNAGTIPLAISFSGLTDTAYSNQKYSVLNGAYVYAMWHKDCVVKMSNTGWYTQNWDVCEDSKAANSDGGDLTFSWDPYQNRFNITLNMEGIGTFSGYCYPAIMSECDNSTSYVDEDILNNIILYRNGNGTATLHKQNHSVRKPFFSVIGMGGGPENAIEQIELELEGGCYGYPSPATCDSVAWEAYWPTCTDFISWSKKIKVVLDPVFQLCSRVPKKAISPIGGTSNSGYLFAVYEYDNPSVIQIYTLFKFDARDRDITQLLITPDLENFISDLNDWFAEHPGSGFSIDIHETSSTTYSSDYPSTENHIATISVSNFTNETINTDYTEPGSSLWFGCDSLTCLEDYAIADSADYIRYADRISMNLPDYNTQPFPRMLYLCTASKCPVFCGDTKSSPFFNSGINNITGSNTEDYKVVEFSLEVHPYSGLTNTMCELLGPMLDSNGTPMVDSEGEPMYNSTFAVMANGATNGTVNFKKIQQ